MSIFSDYYVGALDDREYKSECNRMNREDRYERDHEDYEDKEDIEE